MSMDYFSAGSGRADSGAKEEDALSCLKAEIEDIRSRCNSTAQQSARLEAGMADLRSMYLDTHNQVKGLKQILHASDDADTDSNDSAHHPLLLSRGSPPRKRLPTTLLPRVGSSSQDSAGDDEPASVLQLQQDVNVIGFEVEKLVSKVDPLEDVVKLLNSDIRQLSAKYAKAVDDIEILKASALVGDVVAAADDPRMKMDLHEKIKKLEAEISEIKEMRAQYSFTTMIGGPFRGLKDRFTHKLHHMQQQFRLNMDVLRLNCHRQYERFCQQLDGLIHKLRLYDPFVRGTLFGSAMGLLFLYAYIQCSRPSSQIKQVQAESKAKEEGITKKLASPKLQAGKDGFESMLKEEKKKLVSSQLPYCQDKLEPKPKEQGVVKKLVSSKPQDKLESKPKEEGMERKSRSDKEVAGEGKYGEKSQDEIAKFMVRFGVILLICLLI